MGTDKDLAQTRREVEPRHATDGIPPLSVALCYPLAESTQNTLP
jgi:hypothetical protein